MPPPDWQPSIVEDYIGPEFWLGAALKLVLKMSANDRGQIIIRRNRPGVKAEV